MSQPLLDSIRSSDIAVELLKAKFNDRRLSRRAGLIAEALVRSPASTLPDLCADDAELMAAYRFFNNEKVTPAALLEPHLRATASRASSCSEFLVISDTTEIKFTGERREALGDVSGGDGFLAHLCLAVAESGDLPLPLGLLSLQLLVRDPKRKHRTKRTKTKALFAENNEFRRWPLAIEQSASLLQAPQNAIHVMDREGDSFAFLAWLQEQQHRFVVRVAHDRSLTPDGDEATPQHVSDVFSALEGICQRTIHISARQPRGLRDADKKHPPRDERDATLSFAATRVRLARPHGSKGVKARSLEVNLVRVWEAEPPVGEVPIEWIIATTEPIGTPDQVLRVVDIYRKRWIVEEYFKALKTGCAVEERGFLTGHALQNVFALSLPVAWQLLAMRALSRLPEPVNASTVLTETQLTVLHHATRKLPPKQRPPRNPSVRAALLAIAALGGHVTRNGDPGWLTLRRGFEKLRILTEGYRLAMHQASAEPSRTPRPEGESEDV